MAIYNRRQASTRLLLKSGFDLEHKDRLGWTPLHHCCYRGIDIDLIESLIDKGNAIDASALDGATALGLAAQGNFDHHVRFLISRGANCNIRNAAGESPMDVALQTHAHNALRILLENGADCSLNTEAGETLLHQAAQYGNMESLTTLLPFPLRGIDVEARVTGFIVHHSSDHFQGYTALQIAEQRKDVTPEWLDLFRTLIRNAGHPEGEPVAENGIEETEEFEDALEHQD